MFCIKFLILSFVSTLLISSAPIIVQNLESVVQKCSVKKKFLEIWQNSQDLIESCEIFKSNFFTEYLWTTDSENLLLDYFFILSIITTVCFIVASKTNLVIN